MADQLATERRPVGLGRLYILAVAVLGGAAVVDGVIAVAGGRIPWSWLVFAGLTWLSGSLAIKVPAIPATIYLSETFVFALILLFGHGPAAITVAVDGLLISLRRRTHNVNRYLFNIAEPAVSVWVTCRAFSLATGLRPFAVSGAHPSVAMLLLPVIGMSAVYFLVNGWLTALAISSETRMPAYRVWRAHFLWLGLNTLGGASLGLLLATNLPVASLHDWHRFGDLASLGVVAALIPLLLISYLTFRTSILRVEDANRHLRELNELYVSTVETLAMAIDAKDQVTHGHIRRVQAYAVGLARALGIASETDIKAIEAAALLHDMGKLSVPEFILNKPGKLTPAEYERIKLHAPIGASILSQIKFPFPVVPIVRHHHENWDGTGYPDGLRGEAIPVGARIMAVVDCYDALTSDRPYRAAMSDEQALAIIGDRRGTMYDPRVVDAFLQVHGEIRPGERADSQESHPFLHLARAPLNAAPVEGDRRERPPGTGTSAAEEILLLCELAESLGGRATLGDVADLVARHLRRVVPAPLVVFYLEDVRTGDLVARHSSGFGESRLVGLRVPLGGGLSGWVAANRRTIVNAHPALDLGERAGWLLPRLESALSTPLLHENRLVGVLTLYAASRDAFTDEHRRTVEIVARQIAAALSRSTSFEEDRAQAWRDAATGLPNARYLGHLAACDGFADVPLRLSFGVLALAVEGDGDGAESAMLVRVAEAAKAVLRTSDLIFRYSDQELVVLLPETGPEATRQVAHRLVARLVEVPPPGDDLPILIGLAFAPADGRSIDELLATARGRLERQRWTDIPIDDRALAEARD